MARAPKFSEQMPSAPISSRRTMAADLEDTRLLQELGARLVDEDNIDAIYQEILAAAITLTRADAGVVQILDPASGDLSVLAAKGFDEDLVIRFQRVDASSPTSCGLALQSNQRAYVDFDAPGQSNPAFGLLLEAGYRSAQSTPLISRSGTLIGMLTTHWRERHRPADRELRFLDLLARQAADLIHHRQLEKARHDQDAQFAHERADVELAMAADLFDTQMLSDLATRVVPETEIQAVYDDVNALARRLMDAEGGTLQILDPKTNELVLHSCHGFPKDAMVRFQRVDASSRTSCGLTLSSGSRSFANFDDPAKDDPEGDLRWHLAAGYLCSQSTPLITRSGRPVGILSTHWKRHFQPEERELRFLDMLARQAADLIDQWDYQHALSASEAQLAADLADSKQLQQISSRLLEEGEVDTIYSELLDAAMTLVKADGGSIQRLDEEAGELELLAWHGFASESARAWQRVPTDSASCWGLALKEGRRLVVPDVERTSLVVSPETLAEYRRSRMRALQSTPLTSRSGKPLGILSTSWRRPHEPTEREIRLLDIMARQAADLIDRRSSEEALRDSERRYRALFDSIDEGFCTVEMIFDDAGQPVDYRFLQVNPSFVRLTGISDGVGRTMREITSDHEPHWFESYGRIARTGQPERFVAQAREFQRWYDVYAFRVDDPALNHVAVLFNDVTHRVQTEEKLRRAAALDAYRVCLSDALRPLTDPGEIQAVAARILGERLNASRTVYTEVRSGDDSDYYIVLQHYHAPDTSSLTGTYRANDFGASLFDEMRAGRTLVVHDVSHDSRLTPEEQAAYPRLNVAAYVGVPLLKEGKHVAMVAVHHKTPRQWQPDEISLVEETAERTWAAVERARAEQARYQSEQHLRIALDSAQMASWDWNVSTGSVKWNDQHYRLFGLIPDNQEKSLDYFANFIVSADRERVVALLTRAINEAGPFQCDFRIIRADTGEIRWMWSFGQTVESRDGRALRMTGVIYDDTKVREQAEQLRQAHDALESRVKERTRELATALSRVQDEVDERKKIEAERRDLLQRIVHLQEAERARVARELHDNLGQHMVAVLMHLEGFQRRLTQAGNQEAGHDLEEFRKVVDGLIKATHRQSWELRPAELDELGLEVAVENYVRQWSEKTGVTADFHAITGEARSLEAEEMIALYRVTQEALTNVARHAHANRVAVELEIGEVVCVSIRDNGVGFDPATVKRRLGLLGMQERLDIVGGTLMIDAAPRRGTCVRACLP
jgi:PAS domain S-box-containing protein